MGKSIMCKFHLLLHLIAAILVAQSEGTGKCPFEEAYKCSLNPIFSLRSFSNLVAMVAKPQRQVTYRCKDAGSLPRKLKLNPAAFSERCERFLYHFNGDKFELSMDTANKKFIPITTIDFIVVPSDSWEVKMKIDWMGRREDVRIIFDVGYEKLIVPKAFETCLQKNKHGKSISNACATITFLPPVGSPFRVEVTYKLIRFHDKNHWIFGREAMKQHQYSFYKYDASTFQIDVGHREKSQKKALQDGKGKMSDRVERLRDAKSDRMADTSTVDLESDSFSQEGFSNEHQRDPGLWLNAARTQSDISGTHHRYDPESWLLDSAAKNSESDYWSFLREKDSQ
ncbi:unnamed protein product [Albugo candida]|uniref:Uncharacterized protein n=1 Tax=Albugo candida TaxID=65357 RepID=A0A024FTM2_9STRA|nr:unnamed protein product [Albugo candida]|eukprot:CCI10386.1 unnamed protein product [Albugo candida]